MTALITRAMTLAVLYTPSAVDRLGFVDLRLLLPVEQKSINRQQSKVIGFLVKPQPDTQ